MLANVSPAHSEAEESLSTLRFAESVKKVKTNPQLTELASEEPELLLESFRSEIHVLRDALKRDGTIMPQEVARPISRQIEATEHLMQTLSRQTGKQWAQAVEQTKALEAVQRQLLEQLRLPVQEVGQLAGVDDGTPYLLNISDDPSLSGCLLYFLRSEPEISTVGQAGPDSIAPNSIVLAGLGIPARLCEIRSRNVADVGGDGRPGDGDDHGAANVPGRYLSIRKVCDENLGRVLLNGRPLAANRETEIKHGDRLVFGWAFCFKLIVGTPSESRGEAFGEDAGFESVSKEVLEYSMTSTMSDMGMMRAAAQWQGELKRRNASVEQIETVMGLIGELAMQVEEANALCSELQQAVSDMVPVRLDIGLSFSFLVPQRLPVVVIQVWRQGGEAPGADDAGQFLAAWPAADFSERRLSALRDCHREVLKQDFCGSQPRWAFRLSSEEWWTGPSGQEQTLLVAADGKEEDDDDTIDPMMALESMDADAEGFGVSSTLETKPPDAPKPPAGPPPT
eukprot:TRINITY_DN37323_c0_g1_i1.p1 TRINITY_DN37323_c0_g1~~TRINITY_DN37323_c0_g1_i1.p1  ORF type:complete len:510 (+),score=142.16 TRINITY_DN37323_c0_g1_i1:389-1918(+)